MELEALIALLERSVERNGPDKVLTLGHLLNLLKMLARKLEEESSEIIPD